MRKLSASIDVAAPPEAVFDLIHDYGRRLEWDPFLRRAELLDDATEAGAGVRGRCVAKWRIGGMGMEFVYLSHKRPHVAAIRMTRGPWFLGRFLASLRQVAIEGGTRVTYTFSFEPRPRWASMVLTPVFSRIFLAETRGRLRALKRHLGRGGGW